MKAKITNTIQIIPIFAIYYNEIKHHKIQTADFSVTKRNIYAT